MPNCECGCGVVVRAKWAPGHHLKGKPSQNRNYRGTGTINANGRGGYFWVYRSGHPRARGNGYVKRCWVVVEARLGRFLEPGEDVHHVNGIKTDDSSENLQVLSHGDHAALTVRVAHVCTICGGRHRARGLCSSCYGKLYRRGSPMPLAPSRGNRWHQ